MENESEQGKDMEDKFEGTYKGEFALKYWIPVYGAIRAGLNFGKRESIFHDTPQDWPVKQKVVRTSKQLVWLGYQGVSYFAAVIAVFRGISELEKFLR